MILLELPQIQAPTYGLKELVTLVARHSNVGFPEARTLIAPSINVKAKEFLQHEVIIASLDGNVVALTSPDGKRREIVSKYFYKAGMVVAIAEPGDSIENHSGIKKK